MCAHVARTAPAVGTADLSLWVRTSGLSTGAEAVRRVPGLLTAEAGPSPRSLGPALTGGPSALLTCRAE